MKKNKDKVKSPIKQIYTVQDVVAESFSFPFPAENDRVAMRMFLQAASDPDSSINKSPTDYNLYKLGDWDQDDAQIDGLDLPEFICSADSLLTPKDSSAIQMSAETK